MSEEEWLELPAAPERYLVSTHGRLFSLTRKSMVAVVVQRGVPTWTIYTPETRSRHINIGVTMLETFVQERPDKHVAEWIDGDRTNHVLENLRWKLWDRGEHIRGYSRIPGPRLSPEVWRETQRELRRKEIAERDYSVGAFLPAVKTG